MAPYRKLSYLFFAFLDTILIFHRGVISKVGLDSYNAHHSLANVSLASPLNAAQTLITLSYFSVFLGDIFASMIFPMTVNL